LVATIAWFASGSSALAQLALPTVVDFTGDEPGAYDDPDPPWYYVQVVGAGTGATAPTRFSGVLPPFENVKLRTLWGRVEINATYEVSFTVGAGGLSTVELAMANVALRLSGPGLSSPIELALATRADPLRTTINRTSANDAASGSMTRSRKFTVDVASGPAEVELTLEWATSALTYTQGATIEELAHNVTGKVDGNVAVPEPRAAVLLGIGALGYCLRRRLIGGRS
jgi:MprA protease rhombosortase-interaction domain-containing protein